MFILLVVAIVFVGCSDITYSIIQYSDGSLEYRFEVDMDSEKLQSMIDSSESSYTVDDVKNDIEGVYVQNMSYNYNIYVSNIINYGYSMYLTELKEMVSYSAEWVDDYFCGRLIFYSDLAYILYYEIDITQESDSQTVVEGVFVDKILTTTKTIFSSWDSDTALYNYMKEKYGDLFDMSNVNYTYNYVTTSARLHSDADYVSYVSGGSYVHTWELWPYSEREINIYYLSANYISWYILGLGLTVVFIILCLIKAMLENAKERKKRIKEN